MSTIFASFRQGDGRSTEYQEIVHPVWSDDLSCGVHMDYLYGNCLHNVASSKDDAGWLAQGAVDSCVLED